jgi:chemotaxis protein methyltransferase CheR
MMPFETGTLEAFRGTIARRLGLNFDESKYDFLADVLRQRMSEGGHNSADAYFRTVDGNSAPTELGRLAGALTVTETYFFRNTDHFRALIETVLPERMAIRAGTGTRRLRILSAGCASGEEALTLAMMIDFHFPGLSAWDIRIRGVDINPVMLAKAKEGLYSPWALRDTPAWALERHFTRSGGGFRLSEEIRSKVAFEERNLSEANEDLWEKESFDFIFFRNVMMYLVPDAAARLVSRMAAALVPGGHLFLGHAETLRGLSNAFHLCHTHGTFYYRKLQGAVAGKSAPRAAAIDAPVPKDPPGIAPMLEPSTAWVEVIRKASERIAGLEIRGLPAPLADAAPLPRKPGNLGDALELLASERFEEAMDSLRRLPPDSGRDPDALLLRAVLLTNMGKRSEAEAVCRDLLASDDLNSGAHYLMALCREHADDFAAAEEHDLAAIHLDASFAMPWLHRGLMSKRRGNPEESLRHLGQALTLLTREDPSRILMFGGGFGREALIQLCRIEIRAKEGQR